MPLIIDQPGITEARSPATIEIALLNNLGDGGLKGGERQFIEILREASGPDPVRLRLFSLPGIPRGPEAQATDRGALHRLCRPDAVARRRPARHRLRAGSDTPVGGACLGRADRCDRLGRAQHALDHLVVPRRACRGAASRRHRTSAARKEVLGPLQRRADPASIRCSTALPNHCSCRIRAGTASTRPR